MSEKNNLKKKLFFWWGASSFRGFCPWLTGSKALSLRWSLWWWHRPAEPRWPECGEKKRPKYKRFPLSTHKRKPSERIPIPVPFFPARPHCWFLHVPTTPSDDHAFSGTSYWCQGLYDSVTSKKKITKWTPGLFFQKKKLVINQLIL